VAVATLDDPERLWASVGGSIANEALTVLDALIMLGLADSRRQVRDLIKVRHVRLSPCISPVRDWHVVDDCNEVIAASTFVFVGRVNGRHQLKILQIA